MNNRFKFRFFETYNNTMLDCKDYDFEEILESGKPVMQCTGLKDKNGKLIYEGDVVKFKNTDNKYYIGTIKYTGEDALFCLSYRNENNRGDWDYVSRYKLEVIGNIYENPELLEEE